MKLIKCLIYTEEQHFFQFQFFLSLIISNNFVTIQILVKLTRVHIFVIMGLIKAEHVFSLQVSSS